MNIISHENEIPNDAEIDETFKKIIDGKNCGTWQVFTNWMNVVYAAEINSIGHIMEDSKEVILR